MDFCQYFPDFCLKFGIEDLHLILSRGEEIGENTYIESSALLWSINEGLPVFTTAFLSIWMEFGRGMSTKFID